MIGVKCIEIYQSYIVMTTYEASQYPLDAFYNFQGDIIAITKTDENFNLIWKISFKNADANDPIMTLNDERNIFVVFINPSLMIWFYKLDSTTGQLIRSKCNQYLELDLFYPGIYLALNHIISMNSEYLAIDLSNIVLGIDYLVQSKN